MHGTLYITLILFIYYLETISSLPQANQSVDITLLPNTVMPEWPTQAPLISNPTTIATAATTSATPTISLTTPITSTTIFASTTPSTPIISTNTTFLNLTANNEKNETTTNPDLKLNFTGTEVISNLTLNVPNVTTSEPINQSNTTLNPKVQMLKPKVKVVCNQPSDCKNGGLCFNGTCFCAPGFTGELCDTNIDECRQFAGGQPCLNNGTCVDGINEFRCDCPLGYRGPRCQDLADMCNDSPCLNNATCINHQTSYTCKCEPGWEGKHCEIETDDCAKSPCQNGATCHDLLNSYRCECQPGFTGENCEVNINECATSPCQNNATCRDLINDYECECPPGFIGRNCEENIDDCLNSPCHHGTCTDLINGFKCTCHDGWKGEQCETDINECDSGRPVCLNGGSCENLEPSYRCICRDGWTGRDCSEISDYCKAKRPCGKYGSCKNTNIPKSPFQCECHSGHIGNRCERKRDCLNECQLFSHAHCVSNVTCACLPTVRREDKIMCEYVASCEQVEGDLCLNGGTCRNLDTGGYQCLCLEPFYGPICQFMAERQFNAVLFVIVTCVVFLLVACAVVSLLVFRSVRKARATRGTYSPSTQEKFGNSASDLLKPPIPERLI